MRLWRLQNVTPYDLLSRWITTKVGISTIFKAMGRSTASPRKRSRNIRPGPAEKHPLRASWEPIETEQVGLPVARAVVPCSAIRVTRGTSITRAAIRLHPRRDHPNRSINEVQRRVGAGRRSGRDPRRASAGREQRCHHRDDRAQHRTFSIWEATDRGFFSGHACPRKVNAPCRWSSPCGCPALAVVLPPLMPPNLGPDRDGTRAHPAVTIDHLPSAG